MSVCQVLFLCFFSALWPGNTSYTIFQIPEQKDFRIVWAFPSTEKLRFFCRRQCKDEDVLVSTTENIGQAGRYRMEYKPTASGKGVFTASITNVTKSDTGRYRISLGRAEGPGSYGDFGVRVIDKSEKQINIHTGPVGGNVSVVCYFASSQSKRFFCKNKCEGENILIATTSDDAQNGRYSINSQLDPTLNKFAVSVAIEGLRKSDSGRYLCRVGEALWSHFMIEVTDGESAATGSTPSPGLRTTPVSSSPVPMETTGLTTGTKATDLHHTQPRDVLPLAVRGSVVVLLAAVVLAVHHVCRLRKKKQELRGHRENCPPGSAGERPPIDAQCEMLSVRNDPISSRRGRPHSAASSQLKAE